MKMTCSFTPEADATEARTGEVLEPREDGFFLASNTLYPPGTVLSLLVSVPGKRLPVRLRGHVAWARTTERAGMQVSLIDRAAVAAAPERSDEPPASDAAVKPRGPLRQ